MQRFVMALAATAAALPLLTHAAPPLFEPPGHEEAPATWVVYGQPAHDVDAGLRERFLIRSIESRFPDLKYSGHKAAGGLAFTLREGAAAQPASLHRALEAHPGVMAAGPLPSESEVLRSRAKQSLATDATGRAGGLIVRFRDPALKALAASNGKLSAEALAKWSRIAEVEIVEARAMSGGSFVLRFRADLPIYDAELAAQRLRQSPEVELASPDGYIVPQATSSDPGFSAQWNLAASGGGMNIQPAWDRTTGSAGVVIAIVDSGILGHPEFSDRLLPGYDFISYAEISNDGGGRDGDPTDAGDWTPAGYCAAGTAARASTWHGTHVAGIIGASGSNGMGIAGINWRSPIVPVRALGRCGGAESDILDALRWAAGIPVPGVPNNANPARVINMSLGGAGNCILQHPAYQEAVLDALDNHATVVVAAGNENESALSRVPASCIGTIKVAAVGPSGDKAAYSNYSRAIEIAAPGGDGERFGQAGEILSTYVTGTQSDPGNATWNYMQGTSMAAPHVTGAVSLALSLRPSLTVAQVRDAIRATARAFPAGSRCITGNDCGVGILDAGALAAFVPSIAQRINFSDLWWVPSESGWGLNLQQQGDKLFGTWFTYGVDGKPLWLVMSDLRRVSEDFFMGDIYGTTGKPHSQVNGTPAVLTVEKVGQAIVAFFGVGINLNPNMTFDSGLFYYEIGGVEDIKPIEREQYANTFTLCGFTTGSRASDTNYQDLWWNPSENGWGINFTHQGDTLFATWFTYAADTRPYWYVASAMQKTGPSTFTGRLYQTTGIPWSQISFSTAVQSVTDVGSLTVTFANGTSGRMDYTVNGVTGSKQIERQVFSTPQSTCRPMT